MLGAPLEGPLLSFMSLGCQWSAAGSNSIEIWNLNLSCRFDAFFESAAKRHIKGRRHTLAAGTDQASLHDELREPSVILTGVAMALFELRANATPEEAL